MKKMIKRILCAVLVLLMTAGAFTGCGEKEPEAPEGARVLRVAIPQSSVITSYDENDFTEYLEKELNMEIEFSYFSSNVD